MKLATLREGGRDGTLIVVSRDLRQAVTVPLIAKTMQVALDHWAEKAPELRSIYHLLNDGKLPNAFDLDLAMCAAPLPRAYQFADGSAYLNHVELVRKARGAEMPPSFLTDPLIYQGLSDGFLSWCAPVSVASEDYGIDFEAEIAVITDDVPMGVKTDQAGRHIKLVALLNDVSLRNLIPAELAKGFGFFNSKPASAFAPVVVEPSELGDTWRDYKVHLPMLCSLNGKQVGRANAGIDMQFSFADLIAHVAKTRALSAGSIIGSGTISNRDRAAGWSCIAEVRMIETIEQGKPSTPFMKFGDRIEIDMKDAAGNSIFGQIDQTITHYEGS